MPRTDKFSTARKGLLVALAVLAADQISKWLMLYEVGMMTRAPFSLGPFLDIVMVWNRGVSFGMFSKSGQLQVLLLVVMSLCITAVLLNWLARTTNAFEARAIGLVIGGALGNVVDRFLYGAVADFFALHIGPYYWPAFNVADAGICVGVALLCLRSMLPARKKATP